MKIGETNKESKAKWRKGEKQEREREREREREQVRKNGRE